MNLPSEPAPGRAECRARAGFPRSRRLNRRMPSRRVRLHSSARHPASIKVPYTGSHGSASCHGAGEDRRAKIPATTACAPTAHAARANSIRAGPRHVSVPASRRPRRASWEFGCIAPIYSHARRRFDRCVAAPLLTLPGAGDSHANIKGGVAVGTAIFFARGGLGPA